MASVQLVLDQVSLVYSNGRRAVDQVSLSLGQNVLGLLGPNGAGKTSLMSMLATQFKPTSGRVIWNGVDIVTHPNFLRPTLGYLPQHFGVYPALTAHEFLHYLAAAKGLPASLAKRRVEICLDAVGLSDVANQRLGGFSGGMKQRVGISQALLNDPGLLIIDEPTVGLDPEERLRFRLLLNELATHRLIILSTHVMSDIEASAVSIAILSAGRLRFHDTSEALLARAAGKVWEWTIGSDQLAAVRSGHTLSSTARNADGILVRTVGDERPDPSAQAAIPGLDDAYLYALNH